jgi:hypothetical protein
MKSRELASLLANIVQVINYAKSVNLNREAIDKHTSTLRAGQQRMEAYTIQNENKEYMASISPAEKKCLYDNAQATYTTIQSLQRELDYLDMSKQNVFVINATHELEHVYMLLEYMLEEIVGKNGETILPHLTCIRPKTFDAARYDIQIQSLYAEVEAIAWDFYKDHVELLHNNLAIPIGEHLIVASMWLKREKERTETEKAPEIKKIDLPMETTPEIPASPVEK